MYNIVYRACTNKFLQLFISRSWEQLEQCISKKLKELMQSRNKIIFTNTIPALKYIVNYALFFFSYGYNSWWKILHLKEFSIREQHGRNKCPPKENKTRPTRRHLHPHSCHAACQCCKICTLRTGKSKNKKFYNFLRNNFAYLAGN